MCFCSTAAIIGGIESKEGKREGGWTNLRLGFKYVGSNKLLGERVQTAENRSNMQKIHFPFLETVCILLYYDNARII